MTTLASVHLALPFYDRRAVDGLHVPIEAMQKISGMIAGMDFEERSALPCIGNERADLVVAGCAILEAIIEIGRPRTSARRPRNPRGHPAFADGARRLDSCEADQDRGRAAKSPRPAGSNGS